MGTAGRGVASGTDFDAGKSQFQNGIELGCVKQTQSFGYPLLTYFCMLLSPLSEAAAEAREDSGRARSES